MTAHVERLRVEWVDTDASGRIHYTAGFRYFEAAEHALARKLLGGKLPQDLSIGGFPRVRVEANLRAGLVAGDVIECTAGVEEVGRSSVTYGFEVKRADGQPCLDGRIVAVAIDDEGQTMLLPAEIRGPYEAAMEAKR